MTDQRNKVDQFLVVAQLESVYKNTPFFKIRLYTDFPERVSEGNTVYLDFFGQMKALLIEEAAEKKQVLFVRLKNFSTADDCKTLVGKYLYIPEAELKELPDYSFYVHDLIGSSILAADRRLGVIIDVLSMPANDVYVVKTADSTELLVPASKEIIESFDAQKKVLQLKVDSAYFGE